MAWLFGQVWIAYLAAFAAGVGLSWLLLVRPAQRRLRAAAARRPPAPDRPAPDRPAPDRPAPDHPTRPAPAPAPTPATTTAPARPADVEETVRLPAVDPALSTLDHSRGSAGIVAAGVAALGALDGRHRDGDTARLPVVAPRSAPRGPVVPGAFPRSARPLPDGGAPTPEHTVKGSARSMLYHTPTSPHYSRTTAEVWFTSAEDAEAAGFADVRSRRG